MSGLKHFENYSYFFSHECACFALCLDCLVSEWTVMENFNVHLPQLVWLRLTGTNRSRRWNGIVLLLWYTLGRARRWTGHMQIAFLLDRRMITMSGVTHTAPHEFRRRVPSLFPFQNMSCRRDCTVMLWSSFSDGWVVFPSNLKVISRIMYNSPILLHFAYEWTETG